MKRPNVSSKKKNPFNCHICNESFAEKTDLNIHINAAHDRKPYQCITCGARFSQYDSLRAHTLSDHYTCRVCDKGFSSDSKLKTHRELVHEEKKPDQSTTFDATFTQMATVSSHGAVAQLDDTGVGPGTFVTLKGACGITTTVSSPNPLRLVKGDQRTVSDVEMAMVSSHGAVAQLEDTGVGPGTFVTLKGACGITTTTTVSSPNPMRLVKGDKRTVFDVEKDELEVHENKKRAKPLKKWTCSSCDDSFDFKKELTEHFEEAHRSKVNTIRLKPVKEFFG